MELIRNIFKKTSVQLVLIYAVVCILAIHFGDRGWYEPDGVSILAGSLNLPQAKQGNFFLYAYSLQPLTYELNYIIFRFFKDPYLLYLLPAFFGTLGISFLALAVYFFSRKRINVFCSFCLLLLFPELFYRLLYPNSSVFGMLFFSLAVLLLSYREAVIFLRTDIKCLLAGVLSALACLFRCDFLLGLPMLAYWLVLQKTAKKPFFFYIFGNAIIFIISFLNGFFNPAEILTISSFYSLLAKSPSYWSVGRSLVTLFFTTNVFIWFILLSYAAIKSLRAIHKKNWASFFVIVPLMVLFYPVVGGITSAHYLLCAICLAPFLLIKAVLDFDRSLLARKIKINPLSSPIRDVLGDAPDGAASGRELRPLGRRGSTFQKFSYILIILSILLQFFSIGIRIEDSGFAYPVITTKPIYILTHDGPRTDGAYLKGYYQVYKSNQLPCSICPLGLAHAIANIVAYSPSDFIMVYASQKEYNHLISLGLYGVPFFLQVKGYILGHSKEGMLLSGKHNKLLIKSLDIKDYNEFKESASKGRAEVVKIPLVARTDPQLYKKLDYFYKKLQVYLKMP